jgi:hypothetical protein
MRTNLLKIATLGTAAAILAVPSLSLADGRARQDRNQWNSVAIGAAAVGVIGLLSHNDTLATAGLAGAGYSIYRADSVRNGDWDRHDFRYDGRSANRFDRRDNRDNRDNRNNDNRYDRRDHR